MKLKIISILDSFSKEDFSRFGDFVRSPFFNTNAHLITLYDFICERYPQGSSAAVSYETMTDALRGKMNSISSASVRKSASLLAGLAEQYLVHIHMEKYPYYGELFLFKELNSRMISGEAEKKLTAKRLRLRHPEELDPFHLFLYLGFLVEENRLNLSRRYYTGLRATASEYAVTERLVHEQIRLIGVILDLFAHRTNGTQPAANSSAAISEYGRLGRNSAKDHPSLFMLSSLICYFQTNDYSVIDAMNNCAEKNHGKIFYGIIDLVYNYLLNDLFFVQEYERSGSANASMLRTLRVTGYLKRLKIIPPAVFVTVAELFASRMEAASLKKHIEANLVKVNPDFRDSLYHLSLGILYKSAGKFKEAYSSLSLVGNIDAGITLTVKMLFTQIAYETGNEADLTRQCESIRFFIKRHSELHERALINAETFRHNVLLLSRLWKDDEGTTEKFIQSLKNEPAFYYRTWMVKKAEEYVKMKPNIPGHLKK